MFASSRVIVKVLKSGQKSGWIYWEEIIEFADGWEEVLREKNKAFNDESIVFVLSNRRNGVANH